MLRFWALNVALWGVVKVGAAWYQMHKRNTNKFAGYGLPQPAHTTFFFLAPGTNSRLHQRVALPLLLFFLLGWTLHKESHVNFELTPAVL